MRGCLSARVSRIIEMNGALPVPELMNRWVRSSSGSSMNLPFGPIIRIRCPTGSSHSKGVNVPPSHEAQVDLVAGVARVARRRRHRIRPLDDLAVDEDADRHVLARLEGRRLAVEPDPEVGQALVLVDATDQRRVVALVIGRDDAGRFRGARWRGIRKLGHGHDGTRPNEAGGPGRGPPASRRRCGVQPPLSPLPRQDTVGFQSENVPSGFDLYSQ